MVLTAAIVDIVGRGTGIKFSENPDVFKYFKKIAEARAAKDLPVGLNGDIADHCVALMICHLYLAGSPEVGMRSFSNGDFSGSQDAGETIYLKEYRQLIQDFQNESKVGTQANVTRSDSSMGDFKLDQVTLPTYYKEST